MDQTIAVLTTEQSKAFKWTVPDQVIETEDNKLDDDFGRIISFEVAQTRDEVEGVSSMDGFQVFSSSFVLLHFFLLCIAL